jgi:hypothetical protein
MKEPEYKKPVDKSQLIEYDLFYKEQFFKNEVFLYDVENIEDKVESEIKKEMNRLEIKRKLIEKKKLKEVNDLKKMDTTDLQKEIDELQKAYENCKKKEEPKVELELNNTEGFLHNGRMLGNYFKEHEEMIIPRFAMESEKEIGAKTENRQICPVEGLGSRHPQRDGRRKEKLILEFSYSPGVSCFRNVAERKT